MSQSRSLHRIGLIGYGAVGSNITRNLLRNNFEICSIFDRYKYESLSSDNPGLKNDDSPIPIAIANSVEEMRDSECNVIITALPKPCNVYDVVMRDQLFKHMKEGDVWIDHSTTDYKQTLQFAQMAKEEYGIHTLEAPITGGISLLAQGLMTMYIGGERHIYESCHDLFRCSANQLFYMGAIGSATITKVVSNMLASVNTVAMGEALMIAKRSNMDLSMFWDAIRFSAGNSFVWETEAPLVMNRTYDPNFTLELQCKDMQLGHEISEEIGVPLQIHSVAHQIYNRAKYKYGENCGSSMPPRLLEEDLNTSLEHSRFAQWNYSLDPSVSDCFALRHHYDRAL